MSAPNQVNKLRGEGQPARVQDNVSAVLNPLAQAVGLTPIMGANPPSWIRPDIISTSGWAQAAATTAAPLPVTAYHKDALGYVHGKVALTTAAGVGANTVPFVIGGGYRPGEFVALVMGDGGGNLYEVSVHPNGNFTVDPAIGAGGLFTGLFTYLAEL